ncbi:MAG: hypothetical protein H0V61_09745 [Chitinophagales bacterium]|nr:hypothetical protein [Chitinophagales bacterium]
MTDLNDIKNLEDLRGRIATIQRETSEQEQLLKFQAGELVAGLNPSTVFKNAFAKRPSEPAVSVPLFPKKGIVGGILSFAAGKIFKNFFNRKKKSSGSVHTDF